MGAGDINPNAPTDLVRLFNLLDIPYNKTKRGNPSFTKELFESLNHPVGETIRDLKKYNKAKKDAKEREKMSWRQRLWRGKIVAKAAGILSSAKGALHLRTLQAINDISSDQSNTIVFAIPL